LQKIPCVFTVSWYLVFMKANKETLRKLEKMARNTRTSNESKIAINSIANKLHTLLENKLGLVTITEAEETALVKMAKILATLAK
jgi:hypothetical protein